MLDVIIVIFILLIIFSFFSENKPSYSSRSTSSQNRTNYFPNKCAGCKYFNGTIHNIGDRYSSNTLVDCAIGERARISDGCHHFFPKCTGCQSDCLYLREGSGPGSCDYGHKYHDQLNKPCFQYSKKDYYYDS